MSYVVIPLAFVLCGTIGLGVLVAFCASIAHVFTAYAGLTQADAQVATQITLLFLMLISLGIAVAHDLRKPPHER